jgi:PPM family protein phosphatase
MVDVNAFGLSDVGRQRQHNEDMFLVDTDAKLFIVADGMGGHAAGEVASSLAVEAIADFVTRTDEEEATWPMPFDARLRRATNRLLAALHVANRRVIDAMRTDSKLRGMGTTVVTAMIEAEVASFAHLGDSRAYLIRRGALSRITNDHSWVFEQVQAGMLSEEEAERHPLRNVITRALGGSTDVVPDATEVQCEPADVFLLCSDGLTGMISDEQILQIVSENSDLETACHLLIQAANEGGGQDNITAVLVQAL